MSEWNPAPRAAVFDAYGTLFDVAAAAARCEALLGDKMQPLAALWRTKQLEYTWLRTLMRRYEDFWQVTADALDYAMEALGIADAALQDRLMALYRELDAYADARPTLERLRAAGLSTAILSNGSPTMLQGAVDGAGLGALLDDVLSVDRLQRYKPIPEVYELACTRFGVTPERICFVSANGWDIAGAASTGMRCAWINRGRQPLERLPARPVAQIRSLSELPPLLGL